MTAVRIRRVRPLPLVLGVLAAGAMGWSGALAARPEAAPPASVIVPVVRAAKTAADALPRQIGAFTRGETTVCPDPAQGISIRYESDAARADVYFYAPAGAAGLAEGVDDPRFEAIWAVEAAAVAEMTRAPDGGRMRPIGVETLRATDASGRPPLALVVYAGGQGDAAIISHLLLTAWWG